jgi:hypothetical protein
VLLKQGTPQEKPSYRRRAVLFIQVLLLSLGFEMAAEASNPISIKSVSLSAWNSLSEKRIFFGHQSVGFNILDGIRDVMEDSPEVKLRIIESTNHAGLAAPAFVHSRVGRNGDPESKIESFTVFMESCTGGKIDIAFFKFCFVDFGPKTDVQTIFENYKNRFSKLRAAHPETKFVHFTVPLSVNQTGWKAWIKKLLGRRLEGYAENEAREKFNRMLRAEYSAGQPFFDLAKIESALPNNRRVAGEDGGKAYFGLAPQYTDDGAHLNTLGRRVVAEQLLCFLAQLQSEKH